MFRLYQVIVLSCVWNKHTNNRELLKDIPWVTAFSLLFVYWINHSTLGVSLLYIVHTKDQRATPLWHIPYKQIEMLLLFNLGYSYDRAGCQLSPVDYKAVSDGKESSLFLRLRKLNDWHQSNNKPWIWGKTPLFRLPVWGSVCQILHDGTLTARCNNFS